MKQEMSVREATEYLSVELQKVHGEIDYDDDVLSSWQNSVRKAVDAAKNWNWREAGSALNRAYRQIGSYPPSGYRKPLEAGYAFHCGTHPVQSCRQL